MTSKQTSTSEAHRQAWHRHHNPPEFNEENYARIHKYVKENYLPHSSFMTIYNRFVDEVAAILLLCGAETRKAMPLSVNRYYVYKGKIVFYGGTDEEADDWILNKFGLELLGVIKEIPMETTDDNIDD